VQTTYPLEASRLGLFKNQIASALISLLNLISIKHHPPIPDNEYEKNQSKNMKAKTLSKITFSFYFFFSIQPPFYMRKIFKEKAFL